MAQQDTGLGWSAKSEYLIESNQAIGQIVLPSFNPNTIPFNSAPTVSDLVNYGATFKISGSTYYIGVYCRNGYVGGQLEVALYRAADSNVHYISFMFFSDEILRMYYPSFFITDGVTLWRVNDNHNANATSPDPDTGLYTITSFYNIYYSGVSFSTLSDGTAITGTSIEDIETKKPKTTIDCYKLNFGYSVTCFAKWITTEGNSLISPILISTYPDGVIISEDGLTPASPQTSINLVYEGLPFTMNLLPGINGDSGVASSIFVPIIDLSQFGASAPSKVLALIASESFANILVPVSPDPYEQESGASEVEGGDGQDDEEDDVDFTDPPSTSIGATGFLTIFCPTLGQLQSLGTYMWGSFDVDNWRKLFANPMDAILGLHIIPIPAIVTGNKAVKVAGIDTTIDMNYTTVRYIRRSMGTCDIPKKWGAYLDFTPYTKISVFLPYIGFKEIDADDIMGKTIALQYIIDILTGACVAELKCGDTVLYSWQGNCANEVPISSSDWRGAIASAIGIAGTVAAAVATGGASAPMVAGTIASVGANSLNLKPTVNRSGAISGSAGFLGNQRPYIIRSVPNLVIPADQNKFIGYPSFVTASLGSLTGYNEISAIHLEGIPATGNELSEIETLLKGGVIF